MSQYIDREIGAEMLGRELRARLEVSRLHADRLVEEYRNKVAETLLSCGIHLIPSDHLLDHQYVVSRGVYDAAKALTEKE